MEVAYDRLMQAASDFGAVATDEHTEAELEAAKARLDTAFKAAVRHGWRALAKVVASSSRPPATARESRAAPRLLGTG